MSLYSLHFTKPALREWDKLDHSIKKQFQKKLKERLEAPRVQSDKLSSYDDVYKIKLRNIGYRLAYEVKDEKLIVVIIKIGKRDKFYKNLDFLV